MKKPFRKKRTGGRRRGGRRGTGEGRGGRPRRAGKRRPAAGGSTATYTDIYPWARRLRRRPLRRDKDLDARSLSRNPGSAPAPRWEAGGAREEGPGRGSVIPGVGSGGTRRPPALSRLVHHLRAAGGHGRGPRESVSGPPKGRHDVGRSPSHARAVGGRGGAVESRSVHSRTRECETFELTSSLSLLHPLSDPAENSERDARAQSLRPPPCRCRVPQNKRRTGKGVASLSVYEIPVS